MDIARTDLSVKFFTDKKLEELTSSDDTVISYPIGQLLIDFLECDLALLDNVFRRDVTLKLPVSTEAYEDCVEKLEEIKNDIKSIHPYFQCLYGKIDLIEIGYSALEQEISHNNGEIKNENNDKLKDLNKKIVLFQGNYNSPYSFIHNAQHNFIDSLMNCLDIDVEENNNDIRRRFFEYTTKINPYFFTQNNLKVSYDPELKEIYDVETVANACFIEFIMMVRCNIWVRKCKYCNKYFIPQNRIDNLYCHRILDGQSKSCFQTAAMKKYAKKINENPVFSMYQKVYKKMNARVRLQKISKQDFYIWSEEARSLRDKALKNEISADEFKNWLKESE